MNSNRSLNLFFFILLAFIWGGSFIAIKVIVDFVPPLVGAFLRVLFALVFLSIILRLTKKEVYLPWLVRWRCWLVGIFAMVIPFGFLFWAEQWVSPSIGGILNGTVPIWTYLLGLFFLRHSTFFSIGKAAGLLIGISGIFMIFWPKIHLSGYHYIGGGAAVLVMAISYAISALLNQQVLAGKVKIGFYPNIYHQHVGAVVMFLLLSFLLEKWPNPHLLISSSQLWMACIYLGLIATAVAFLMYYHLIREWGAVRASSIMYAFPITAQIWDFIFFKHVPNGYDLMGMTGILVGLLLIQFSKGTITMRSRQINVNS